MAWHESLRGSAGRRRPPLTGFLKDAAQPHPATVNRSRFQARDLINLLLRHFGQRRPAPEPRCQIRLNALTPSGRQAVRIVTRRRVTTVTQDSATRAHRG